MGMTEKKLAECCVLMERALAYSHEQGMKLRPRPTAGLVQGYLFSRTGATPTSPVVYFVPGTGRGKERVQPMNVLINFCPFCGKKHREMEEVEGTLKKQAGVVPEGIQSWEWKTDAEVDQLGSTEVRKPVPRRGSRLGGEKSKPRST